MSFMMMREPLLAGAGGDSFDRSEGWSEMKKINGDLHHSPPRPRHFCNIMVSIVSKYFYILIKNILMRSVGQALLLTILSAKVRPGSVTCLKPFS